MVNDSKIVYETISKLAGLTVIFDPTSRRDGFSVELADVTLEQALDVVSFEAKAFWKPVTQNIVMVIPDTSKAPRLRRTDCANVLFVKHGVVTRSD